MKFAEQFFPHSKSNLEFQNSECEVHQVSLKDAENQSFSFLAIEGKVVGRMCGTN
jgi:hypothetical protein